jgi:hypothetical protein
MKRTTSLIKSPLAWPFVCTKTHELDEETIASYLYQVHLYSWLESNGYGRWLANDDL